jgi:hypothetical protein
MANSTKLNRVFNFIELNYTNLTNQITNWLSSVYDKSSILFNAASPFGQILEVTKEFFLQNILYLKNFVRQLDIDQANTRRAINNIARISGHNSSRAISAKGTLKFKLKQGINIDTMVSGGQVTIYDNTTLKNKSNSLYYALKVGSDKNIYSLTPGCQFFVNIVQGKYDEQTFTGDGTPSQSFQVTVANNASIDNFDFQVILNGNNLQIKDHLYDMLENELACYTRTGFNGGLDVYFGNGKNGIIPPIGSVIQVKYLLNNGLQGNILNNKVNDFTFVDDIYDSDGNILQASQLFDLFVETNINFASDGENINYTKSVVPYVSRNFVLATPPQFIYHLKKLNMFSKVNAFNTLDMIKIDIDSDGSLDQININEMYLYLIPRITDYFSTNINYFNVPFDAFYLDDEEKQRILTYLKIQGIISITSVIKIIDPIIKRFAVNIFIRRYDDVSEENIREQTINILSTYFSNYSRYDRVIKADLITQLKSIDGVDSVNLEFVGKDNEDYHRDGALLSSTQKNITQTTYATTTKSVNISAESYKTMVTNQQQAIKTNQSSDQTKTVDKPRFNVSSLTAVKGTSTDNSASAGRSVSADGSRSALPPISIGNTTVVAYQDTQQYDPKRMVGIDPILGDIVIGKNELIVLRGGWSNRNNVFFHEDPKSTVGFSTINFIWKGVTPRK